MYFSTSLFQLLTNQEMETNSWSCCHTQSPETTSKQIKIISLSLLHYYRAFNYTLFTSFITCTRTNTYTPSTWFNNEHANHHLHTYRMV